jgi:hypothetical protein
MSIPSNLIEAVQVIEICENTPLVLRWQWFKGDMSQLYRY